MRKYLRFMLMCLFFPLLSCSTQTFKFGVSNKFLMVSIRILVNGVPANIEMGRQVVSELPPQGNGKALADVRTRDQWCMYNCTTQASVTVKAQTVTDPPFLSRTEHRFELREDDESPSAVFGPEDFDHLPGRIR